jgi:transcription-repair coupling factor (superfamily II helicase)
MNHISIICIVTWTVCCGFAFSFQLSNKVIADRPLLRSHTQDFNYIDSVNNFDIDTSPKARLKLASSRYALPGDFVISRYYGEGEYMGLRYMQKFSSSRSKPAVIVAIVQYQDAVIEWTLDGAEKELFFLKSFLSVEEEGKPELQSILNLKKWAKKLERAKKQCEEIALDLVKTMAMRNCYRRLPFIETNDEFKKFEQKFPFTPTEDQLRCFEVSI